MSKGGSVSTGGVGFCGLLGIAFIVLKLCGVIGWSWWWVTAPLWVPFALALAVFVVGLILIAVGGSKGYE